MRRKLKTFPSVIARWQDLPLWFPVLVMLSAVCAWAENGPPLTTAAAVRGLRPEEAATARPVQLSGTLLFRPQ